MSNKFVGIQVVHAEDNNGTKQDWEGFMYFQIDNIVWMTQDRDITTIFCVNGFFYHTFENVDDIVERCSKVKRRTA